MPYGFCCKSRANPCSTFWVPVRPKSVWAALHHYNISKVLPDLARHPTPHFSVAAFCLTLFSQIWHHLDLFGNV